MIRKDPKASVLAIYNMAKTQIVDEYFPINDDQRNKSLKEEFLQNVRSYHNIQSSLYPYRCQVRKSKSV